MHSNTHSTPKPANPPFTFYVLIITNSFPPNQKIIRCFVFCKILGPIEQYYTIYKILPVLGPPIIILLPYYLYNIALGQCVPYKENLVIRLCTMQLI